MNEQSFFFRHVPTWGTAVAACITAALLVRMQPFYATADLARFAFTCALELALLDLLTRLALMPSRWLLRLPGLVATAAIGCIYTAQLYSVWISGGLVPPIALANQEVTGLISFNGIYALLGGFLSAFCLHAFFSRNTAPRWNIPQTATAVSAIALVYVGIVFHQPVARGIVVDSGEAPVSSFVRTVATYAGMNAPAQISAAQLNKVRAEFLRETTYVDEFPARYAQGLPARPNVIVIFTEGMSARWMETYGGAHAGLMPNLDRVARDSLVFTNYYNHTAATFRGLRGQLTSGHQEIDGYNDEGTGIGDRDVSHEVSAVSRISVPDILRQQGYSSMFFLSQQEFLNKMIKTLGFDRTLGRDYLYDHYLSKPERKRPTMLSDADLFSAMLSELERQPASKPFFAAAYNFQTHAFQDGENKYSNGDNPMLNRFHTYDRDIGSFVERFKASPLHDNTVLVITADHSTYPDPHAVRADPRIATYFVDTIPMLMYWKGIQHNVVDVAGKNSLDLAPTVLSLLGARYGRNLFLGCSLFETCKLDRISNVGSQYILTNSTGSYSRFLLPEHEKEYFQEGKQLIDRYKSIDLVIGTQ
ncbi:LTA synthase family protein [Stenotrophomonas bentonitica]